MPYPEPWCWLHGQCWPCLLYSVPRLQPTHLATGSGGAGLHQPQLCHAVILPLASSCEKEMGTLCWETAQRCEAACQGNIQVSCTKSFYVYSPPPPLVAVPPPSASPVDSTSVAFRESWGHGESCLLPPSLLCGRSHRDLTVDLGSNTKPLCQGVCYCCHRCRGTAVPGGRVVH